MDFFRFNRGSGWLAPAYDETSVKGSVEAFVEGCHRQMSFYVASKMVIWILFNMCNCFMFQVAAPSSEGQRLAVGSSWTGFDRVALNKL